MQGLSHILPSNWKTQVTEWLREDIPSFDYGGFVVGSELQKAFLFCKADGVLCGLPFFDEVFRHEGCSVQWLLEEGIFIAAHENKVHVATVTGPACGILRGERSALNMLARASGIASRGRRLINLKTQHKFKGVIAATRKTTPHFRLVEKYACLVAGVDTHRMDLSTMIMLKDNHIWASGSITSAVHKARSVGGFSLKIEVECQSLEEAVEAINAGADIVQLY
jgi:nicotinate-nucleotide pyrophosphorylase (carboxylating)